MHVLDRLTRRRSSRYVWAPLTLVFVGLLYGSHLGEQRALTQERKHAATRAETIATGIGTGLTANDLDGPILGPTRRGVMDAVGQDPSAARVMIFSPDGKTVFSTIAVAERSPDPGRFAAALDGTTASLRATEPLEGDTGHSVDIFETFVPLRVAGQTPVVGVVEVDHRFSTLTRAAQSPWRPLQILFFVFSAIALVLFVLSLRRPIEVLPGAQTGRRRSSAMAGRKSPVEGEMNRLRAALIEEREQRRQAEETYGFLERRLREAEGLPWQGASDRGPNELEEALRGAEARAARAEARAAEAEERAQDAESRAAEADLRATIAEARQVDQRSIVAESEARATRAETRAVEDEAEVARLREAEAATHAEVDVLRGQLEEARERTRKGVETYAFLESKLREAEDRIRTVSDLGTGADAKLAGLRLDLTAAEGRAQQAEQELGRLRQAEQEVEKLRRELLREREDVEHTPDPEVLAALVSRVDAAEGRAMNADRHLSDLATAARAAASEPTPKPEAQKPPAAKPEPEAQKPPAAKPAPPAAAKPQPVPEAPAAKPQPVPEPEAAAKPQPGPEAPAAKPQPVQEAPAAKPQPVRPVAGPMPVPTPPAVGAPRPVPVKAANEADADDDDDLDEAESDLPKRAMTLRNKLARTAMLKKLGHKGDGAA